MPKRTVILILVLVIITAGLVWLSVYTVPTQKPAENKISTQQANFAKTSITLSSSPVLVENTTYSLDTKISTSENKIIAAQLEISYDPKAIAVSDIVPGDFIKSPVELLKNIDEKNGRISYALGIKMGEKGVAGTGTIAKIMFVPVSGSTLKTTSIDFLPKSKISAEGTYNKSVLKSTVGAVIDLLKLGTVTTSTPSAPAAE
jgi:hypothetical protein